jgi:hypothetical protein
MDPDPSRLRCAIQLARDILVGPVSQDPQLDGAALTVGQSGERSVQVVVEAVEPGLVDGGGRG